MKKRGMAQHESPVNETAVWLTPPHVLAALGAFDLDPCACDEPRPWPTATRHIVAAEDGLAQPWAGRVWCNPPYGAPSITSPWFRRMAEHGRGTMLIFARTETEAFQDFVWGAASGVLFLRGRLAFHRPDGSPAGNNGGAPSCLVSYGPRDAEILSRCGLPGRFVSLDTPRSVAVTCSNYQPARGTKMPELFTFATDDADKAAKIIEMLRGGPLLGTAHPKAPRGAAAKADVQAPAPEAPSPQATVVTTLAPPAAAPAPAAVVPPPQPAAAPPPPVQAPAPVVAQQAAEGWTLEHVTSKAKEFITSPKGGPERLGVILDMHKIEAVKTTPPGLFHIVYGEMDALLQAEG